MADLRKTLVRRLTRLGVEDRPLPGRDDGFSALFHGGRAFAHFHGDDELDIRLTRTLIKREGLTHSPNSSVHPKRTTNSQWIEVRFATPADLDRVVALIELALGTL